MLFNFASPDLGRPLFLDSPGALLVEVAGMLSWTPVENVSDQGIAVMSSAAICTLTPHLIFSSSHTLYSLSLLVSVLSFSLPESSVSIDQGKVALSWCHGMRC